jgi:putative restriction endonuclease
MQGYVATTDFTWFSFLRDRALDEVNFWQPSGRRSFHAVPPGAPFFFKLKRPHDAIGGFGFFANRSVLPAWLAWDVYGEGNGAADIDTMNRNILRLRRSTGNSEHPGEYEIGCIALTSCVFFADNDWVRVPADWAKNIVQGKRYDLAAGEGARLWQECWARAQAHHGLMGAAVAADGTVPPQDRYGTPTLITPRLGQRSFRVAVLDAYGRSCAVSTEHSLPVLEAAHIRSYAQGGPHDVRNGLCLRSDIHRLFDAGYVTVDENHQVVVSSRLKDRWHNGKVYYQWQGQRLHPPRDPKLAPDPDQLAWHREQRFIA